MLHLCVKVPKLLMGEQGSYCICSDFLLLYIKARLALATCPFQYCVAQSKLPLEEWLSL